jgi:hypothetical protein
MARRKRRKNPDGLGAKNVVIALAVGAGVYLLVKTLQNRGILGGNGDDYGVKQSTTTTTTTPVYKPNVVRTLTATKTIIPAATRGPLVPVYQALTKITQAQAAKVQADAAISEKTKALNDLLMKKSNQLTSARGDVNKRNDVLKSFAPLEAQAQGDIDSARRAASVQRQEAIDKAYAEALAAAKAAARDERGLRNEYGDKADIALKQLKSALVDSGDEEFATTEGSVERAR